MAQIIKKLPDLPIERAIRTLSGRWKAVILYHLLGTPKRLSELTRLMPSASQKVLIQQLREMEAHGLVHREVFPQAPPRVDYSATELGLSLEPVMLALCEWGQRHARELDQIDELADCIVRPVHTKARPAPAAHAQRT
ncbi:winged helix-turn-helix transcriptional regulator [Castellaniella hirudinis]|uniref:Winged helix-turn-helix transcriptional regulator n=1 Tax=Castellaniella hirudinis TaxID=1144617 RepID=A0ABV8S1X6_9BURK